MAGHGTSLGFLGRCASALGVVRWRCVRFGGCRCTHAVLCADVLLHSMLCGHDLYHGLERQWKMQSL